MEKDVCLSKEDCQYFLYNAMRQQTSKATEKEIEVTFYNLLTKYLEKRLLLNNDIGLISYTNPYGIDGLLTQSTLNVDRRILIEAKTDRSLKATGVWAPLAQAVQYTHLLQYLDELLPAVIIVVTEKHWQIVQTDSLRSVLNCGTLPWQTAPSERSLEIEQALERLNPPILTIEITSDVDINKQLNDFYELLNLSGYHATKQHDVMGQSSMLEMDSQKYLYESVDNRWWKYHSNSNTWSIIESKDLALELKDEAVRMGYPQRGLSSVIYDVMVRAQVICSIDHWVTPAGLINTPDGVWSAEKQGFVDSDPKQMQRYITGNVSSTSTSLKQVIDHEAVVAAALRTVSGLSNNKIIIGVASNSDERHTIFTHYADALGDYAITGDVGYLHSQWRWNTDRGDAPILLINGSDHYSNYGEAIWQYNTNRNCKKNAQKTCIIILLDEDIFLANQHFLSKLSNTLVLDLSTPCDSSGELLQSALTLLLQEDVIHSTYENENNDLMLAWFNECVEHQTGSFIIARDLLDCYNAWAIERGNTKLSLRTFISNFTSHKTFRDAKLVYTPKKYFTKDENLIQSIYTPNNGEAPRQAGRQETVFINIGFQG